MDLNLEYSPQLMTEAIADIQFVRDSARLTITIDLKNDQNVRDLVRRAYPNDPVNDEGWVENGVPLEARVQLRWPNERLEMVRHYQDQINAAVSEANSALDASARRHGYADHKDAWEKDGPLEDIGDVPAEEQLGEKIEKLQSEFFRRTLS